MSEDDVVANDPRLDIWRRRNVVVSGEDERDEGRKEEKTYSTCDRERALQFRRQARRYTTRRNTMKGKRLSAQESS